MDKRLKNLARLAQTVQEAAADGKITVFEIVKIVIELVRTVKDVQSLQNDLKTATPEELAATFGKDAGLAPQLVATVTGLYTYGSKLAGLLGQLTEKPIKAEKSETKKSKAHE